MGNSSHVRVYITRAVNANLCIYYLIKMYKTYTLRSPVQLTNSVCICLFSQNTITEDDRRGSGYEGDKVKGNVSGAGVKVSETKKRGIYLGGGVGGYHKGGIPGKHQYYYPSG